MRKVIWVLTLVMLVRVQLPASTLSDAANAMAPGTWQQLTTNNFNSGDFFRLGGSILEYTDKGGGWNPLNGTLMFEGGAHGTHPPGIPDSKFLKYTESNNTWSDLPNVFPNFDDAFLPLDGVGHAYHHDTVNPTTGNFYHRQYYSGKVMVFSHSSQAWSQCTPRAGSQQVAGALEYFPDRNSLVYLDGSYGVYELSLASGNCLGSWTQIASTQTGGFTPQLTGTFGYHNQSRYSSACQCIVLGGGNGSSSLYRYHANGTFTPVNSVPFPIAVNTTVFTVDPVTNYILVWNQSNPAATMYEYNPSANTWASISRSSPFFAGNGNSVYNTAALPIPTYGVIMFIHAGSSGGGSVYLYKHAASTPDTENPSVPTGLSATATSASNVSLSWTASTDNVGVAGYRLERCAGTGCSSYSEIAQPTSTSYSDSSAASGTTIYRYRVRARDGANNFSGYSTAAESTLFTGGQTFSQKCAQPGVLSCYPFDSPSEIRYTWETPSSCDTALSGQTKYSWFSDRRAGSANTAATTGNTSNTCYFPGIDSSKSHSGTGSLKFTIPSNSEANTSGWFSWIFKAGDPSGYIAPGSPLGNVVYWQFYQWMDSNFLTTPYQCGTTGGEPCGGWKQIIFYGNAPNGSSASNVEITHNNGYLRGVPQMYGQIGQDDYGIQDAAGCAYNFNGLNTYPEPPCKRYKSGQWMEFKVRVEVRGASNAPQSRVQLWVDGTLAIDIGFAKVKWGSTEGDGLGQFQITPYHTRKYSGQSHPVGFTWIDDLIISTQDISSSSSVDATAPTPPTGVTVTPKP